MIVSTRNTLFSAMAVSIAVSLSSTAIAGDVNSVEAVSYAQTQPSHPAQLTGNSSDTIVRGPDLIRGNGGKRVSSTSGPDTSALLQVAVLVQRRRNHDKLIARKAEKVSIADFQAMAERESSLD